jgi:hypothetical protein
MSPVPPVTIIDMVIPPARSVKDRRSRNMRRIYSEKKKQIGPGHDTN